MSDKLQNLSLEHVRYMRGALEAAIQKEIEGFVEQTGMCPQSIELQRTPTTRISDTHATYRVISVRVTLESL